MPRFSRSRSLHTLKARCAAPPKAPKKADGPQARSARSSAARSALRPARSKAFSASTIVRASANTWSASACPSYVYKEQVRVGTVLPESGVTYYEVPAEYRAPGYRYTVINDRPVIVEPRTRRVVQIID